MMTLDDIRAASFALTTAAQHLVLALVPIREAASLIAFAKFMQSLKACRVPAAELNRVLFDTLAILDRHSGGRLPTLVERYLASTSRAENALESFQRCVEDLLRYRGVDDPAVQRVIAVVEEGYADPTLTEGSAAASVGITPAALCVRFHAHTGRTFQEYRREIRLARSAELLSATALSIKEVWAKVGYNYAANFDHDFKRCFGITPTDYRARVIQSADRAKPPGPSEAPPNSTACVSAARSGRPVLIVDDDTTLCETIALHLRSSGYRVGVASSGEQGLREVARLEPDAILLDYHLGDMDGVHFLRVLRQRNSTRHARVIIFTADWWLDADSEELRRLDARFAWKPCDLETVEELVGTA